MRVPVASSIDRVSSSRRETEAMEGSASPRNPSVEMESRSLTLRSLLVACRSKARSASSRNMPQPSDRKSTRLNSSHLGISYAVFCLKKKKKQHSHVDVSAAPVRGTQHAQRHRQR